MVTSSAQSPPVPSRGTAQPGDDLAGALARAEHLAFNALDAAPVPTVVTPNGKTLDPLAVDQLNSLTTTLYRLAAIRVALAATPHSAAPAAPGPDPLIPSTPTPDDPVERGTTATNSTSAPPAAPDPLLRLILATEKSLDAQYKHEHGLLEPKPPCLRGRKPPQLDNPRSGPLPHDSHFPEDIAHTRNPFHLANPFNRPHLPPLRPGAARRDQIEKSLTKITRDLLNHSPAPPSPNQPPPHPPKRTVPSPAPTTHANALSARPSAAVPPIPPRRWTNLSPALQAQLQSLPTQKPKPPP